MLVVPPTLLTSTSSTFHPLLVMLSISASYFSIIVRISVLVENLLFQFGNSINLILRFLSRVIGGQGCLLCRDGPAPSQRHDKIGMMTARHRDGPCRYHDGGGKWGNFIVTRGQPCWISDGHVS